MSHTTAEGLSTTKQVEFINKKEFVITVLDKNSKIFIVYIVVLEALLLGMTIYSFRIA